jgi:hypothetical protein
MSIGIINYEKHIMDYAFDFYFEQDSNHNGMHFIYDDYRFFSKMFVLLKSLGLFFYITTLTRCVSPEIYIIMNGIMCLSTANSARYEYRHYQRNGTAFSSIHEYLQWKASLWPKSRMAFSFLELGVKIIYFIYVLPPQFDFRSVCDTGKSILMIHILAVFIVYLISCIFTSWIYCCASGYEGNRVGPSRPHEAPISDTFTFPTTSAPADKECCICLDNAETGDALDASQEWVQLPCLHIFHGACIRRWLIRHDTCPICRLNVRTLH